VPTHTPPAYARAQQSFESLKSHRSQNQEPPGFKRLIQTTGPSPAAPAACASATTLPLALARPPALAAAAAAAGRRWKP